MYVYTWKWFNWKRNGIFLRPLLSREMQVSSDVMVVVCVVPS